MVNVNKKISKYLFLNLNIKNIFYETKNLNNFLGNILIFYFE